MEIFLIFSLLAGCESRCHQKSAPCPSGRLMGQKNRSMETRVGPWLVCCQDESVANEVYRLGSMDFVSLSVFRERFARLLKNHERDHEVRRLPSRAANLCSVL